MRETEIRSIGIMEISPQPMSTKAPKRSSRVTVAFRMAPRGSERRWFNALRWAARRDSSGVSLPSFASSPMT